MVVNRGGLLESTGAVALMAARSWRSRAPEGEGDAGGGGGGTGAEEDEDFFGGAGGGEAKPGEEKTGEAKPGEEKTGEAKPGEAKPGEEKPGELAEWMKSFSAEKPGENELSNQEWLAKTGVKDLDALAKRARDTEKAFREGGKVKVPGEGASEAEVKAFREAIGAPLEAKEYAVELPKEAKDFEVDAGFLDPLKEIALKHHIPAAAFKEMGDAFMAGQLASITGDVAKNNADRDAVLKEWGPEAAQGQEEFRRGLDILGLKTADARKIQAGLGAKGTLELFRKIGQMAGEDFFAGNGSRPADRFGVGNAADAKKALDAMTGDKDTRAKLRAKDPVTVQRYNALTDQLARLRQKEAAAR